MALSVEARYLNVKWTDEDTVLKLDKSTLALEIEDRGGSYWLESVTFRKYHPRLAFKVLDDSFLHQPYFQVSGSERKLLLPIEDPSTHETWWIESTGWDKKNKRHHSELWRTVGSVQLNIQNKTILINNNSLGFSVEELEAYLRDFKNNLWMLILNKEGHIKGSIERKLPIISDKKLIKHLKDFTDSTEKLIKNPTIELKETQKVLPIRSVRPVNRTFMELAMKGAPSHLTSRHYHESMDTPENRYMHYAVKRVTYLTRQIQSLGKAQQDSNKGFLEAEKTRLASLKTEKTIDSVVFNNELKEIEAQLQVLYDKLEELNSLSKSRGETNYHTYKVSLTREYGRKEGEYFCGTLNGEDFTKKNETYLVVHLPESHQLPELVHRSSRVVIELTGVIKKEKGLNRNNNLFYRLIYRHVSSAKILEHPLKSKATEMKARRDQLESLGWRVPYTASEKEEIRTEMAFIKKRMSTARSTNKSLESVGNEIGNVFQRLRKLQSTFVANGIGVNSNFPNKMVFVQNPNYSSSKASFEQIRKASGIDESLFESMLAIDQIGLVNISNLYEKWCLLKIIGTLTDTYHFSIEGDWQRKLITAVSKKAYDIEFELSSNNLRRSMRLTYELQLASGKRPDFVLDIRNHDSNSQYRCVLDAKFRDNLTDESLATLVQELHSPSGKNYSENEENPVFIIHASNEAITQRISPLSWGKHSDYGEKHGHKYGGIYLSPSLKSGQSVDNLQRLLGLFLESSNLFNSEEDSDVLEHNAFCIACGNDNSTDLKVERKFTQGGNEKWSVRCTKCHHLHVQSNCVSCHTTLRKNGHYWTYHRTRAEEPFNIVCPECQEFL